MFEFVTKVLNKKAVESEEIIKIEKLRQNLLSSEKEIILNSEEDYKNGFFSGKSIVVSAFYFEEKFLGFILFAGDQNNSFNINDLILLSSVASLISVSIKNISFISEEEARKRLEETRYKQSF